jgi:SET domain
MFVSKPSSSTAALLFHRHSRPNQQPPNPHVSLREISPTLGRGWFAREDLPAGTILWREHPRAVAKSRSNLIQHVFENLSDFQHLCYYDDDEEEGKLYSCCCSSAKRKIAEGIVRCNHFEYSKENFLLFDDISLLNHSCNPNTTVMILSENEATTPGNVFADNIETQEASHATRSPVRALVQTARNIMAGDEITISYSDEALFWPWQERLEYIKCKWGFECCCERCQFLKENRGKVDVDEHNLIMTKVWPLLEQAATVSAASKPRGRSVDPACQLLQQQAAAAIAEYFPYLKQGERFQADAVYFR